MRRIWAIFVLPVLVVCPALAGPAPTDVESLWAGFDPRRDPLNTKIVREWKQDDVTLRYVIFDVGVLKGERARLAGFYAFASGGRSLPGLLHLHGGGQRAFRQEVLYYASRGYACLSINWGGREMEEAEKGDPNTDWGVVDPTQKNVPGYFNFRPGPKHLESGPSPRNNNWYVLTLGARRGLTFLERQAEVDPNRLGVYGHSMGGNLTIYTAGTDKRVKVAAPSVGGSGFRSYPWPLLPEYRPRNWEPFTDLYRKTIAFQAYSPRIRAPLLWLGSTNDFHGLMDDTYRTSALIPHGKIRFSFAPHLNHRFTPPFEITRALWIDQHLKGGLALARTAETKLELAVGEEPRFSVSPDLSQTVEKVAIYYSIDPDPKSRFWRSAAAKREASGWLARLPIMDRRQPLFAFANVHHRLAKPQSVRRGETVSTYALSSPLHTVMPDQFEALKVAVTDQPSKLIDDFQNGWRDWYVLNGNNREHWQYWTRKITDPKWRGRPNTVLSLEMDLEEDNRLVVVAVENEWRGYRGPKRSYLAVVPVKAGEGRTVRLRMSDLRDMKSGEALKTWLQLDRLGLAGRWTAKNGEREVDQRWAGPVPRFRKLEWVTSP